MSIFKIERDIKPDEYNFYALFPLIQYLKAREQKAQYPKGYLIDYELSSKNQSGQLDYHHLVVYNDIKKEVIYSIKGTYWGDFGDLFNDVLIMASIRTLELFNQVSPILRNNIYQITENIIKKYKLNKAKNYKIIFSSHSLGATLQQILLLRESDKADDKKFMRFRMTEYEKGFNKPILDEKEQEDKLINIYEYIDKVYSFEPGVGIFDGIVSLFDKLLLSPKHTEKLRLINNILYVPFSLGTTTAIITDRPGLERIFIGDIQQVEPISKNIGHTIYNYIDRRLVTTYQERIKTREKKIKEKLEITKDDVITQFFEIGKFIINTFKQELFESNKKLKYDYNDVHEFEMGLKEISQEISNNIMLGEKEFEQKFDIKQVERDLDIKLDIKRIVLGYYNLNSPDYKNDQIVLSDVDLINFKFKDELKSKIDTSSDKAVKPSDMSIEEWEDIKKYLFEFKGSNLPYSKEDVDYLIKNSNHNIKVYSLPNIIYDNMPPTKGKGKASKEQADEIYKKMEAETIQGRKPTKEEFEKFNKLKASGSLIGVSPGSSRASSMYDVSPASPFTINNFASSASKNPQVGSPSVHSLREPVHSRPRFGSYTSSDAGDTEIKKTLNKQASKSRSSVSESSYGTADDKSSYGTGDTSYLYRKHIKGSMGTSTAGSFWGSDFEKVAPPDVYDRYIESKIDPYSKGFKFGERARYPEVEIEKTVTEQLFDAQGKPVVGLDNKPIITTKKVKEVKTGLKRSKIPVIKDVKTPDPPKIIKPKPEAKKVVKADKKPESLSTPKKAVPTVPKPKKIVSAKVTIKKLGAKPDKLHKL